MGERIRKRAGAREPEQVSLGELVHQHVRLAIETAVHEELRVALGVRSYERREGRRGPQRREGAHADGPERTGGAHGAPRSAVRRNGMDVDDPAALSAETARGE